VVYLLRNHRKNQSLLLPAPGDLHYRAYERGASVQQLEHCVYKLDEDVQARYSQ
jgi:hypothetical protein